MSAGGREAALVAVGGGIGSSLRYGLGLALAPWSGSLPVNYLLINVAGSFVIGVVLALTLDLGRISSDARLFWAVGVIGGFTTFSTFEAGVFDLLLRGHREAAVLYGVGSLVLGLLAAFAGLVGARIWWRERTSEGIRAG